MVIFFKKPGLLCKKINLDFPMKAARDKEAHVFAPLSLPLTLRFPPSSKLFPALSLSLSKKR